MITLKEFRRRIASDMFVEVQLYQHDDRVVIDSNSELIAKLEMWRSHTDSGTLHYSLIDSKKGMNKDDIIKVFINGDVQVFDICENTLKWCKFALKVK